MENTRERLALRRAAERNEGAKLHHKVASSKTRGLGKFAKYWKTHIYSPHNSKTTDEDERGEYFDSLKASGFWEQGDDVPGVHYAVVQGPAHGAGIDRATRGAKL